MTIAAEDIYDPRLGERRRPHGARLREARLTAGLDQRTLAARIAVRLGDPARQAQYAQVLCRAELGTTRTLDPAVCPRGRAGRRAVADPGRPARRGRNT